MMPLEILLTIITLAVYCLSNSLIMTGLFVIAQPATSFWDLFRTVISKTLLSIGIVFIFFAFLARMFCWTAWLTSCLECICFPLTTEAFAMQSTLPSNILFFFGVTSVQLGLIAIPNRLSPMTFVMIVIASNLIASLLKLGFVAAWPL